MIPNNKPKNAIAPNTSVNHWFTMHPSFRARVAGAARLI